MDSDSSKYHPQPSPLSMLALRMIAFVIDVLIVAVWWVVVNSIGSVIGGDSSDDDLVGSIVLVFIPLSYFVAAEYWLGGTLGKRLLKLQVRAHRRPHGKYSFSQVLFRLPFKFVDLLMFPLSLLSVVLSEHRQSFADKLTGMLVVQSAGGTFWSSFSRGQVDWYADDTGLRDESEPARLDEVAERNARRYRRFRGLRNFGVYAVTFGVIVVFLNWPLDDRALVAGGLFYLVLGVALTAVGQVEMLSLKRKLKAHRAEEKHPEDSWNG